VVFVLFIFNKMEWAFVLLHEYQETNIHACLLYSNTGFEAVTREVRKLNPVTCDFKGN